MAWYLVKHRDNFTLYLTPNLVTEPCLGTGQSCSHLFNIIL